MFISTYCNISAVGTPVKHAHHSKDLAANLQNLSDEEMINKALFLSWHWFRRGYDQPIKEQYPDNKIHEWLIFLMTSSNGNISALSCPLWGESTSYQRVPLTKASDVELCFLWSAPEQTAPGGPHVGPWTLLSGYCIDSHCDYKTEIM